MHKTFLFQIIKTCCKDLLKAFKNVDVWHEDSEIEKRILIIKNVSQILCTTLYNFQKDMPLHTVSFIIIII